jgi:hypothetical protein
VPGAAGDTGCVHAAVLPTLESTPDWLADVAALCDRLPVPDGGWHPWAADIGALRDDFSLALAIGQRHPDVLERLEELLFEHEPPAALAPPDDALAAAFARATSLPRPSGQHPYLDVVAPALEAVACVLAALAASPQARDEFAAGCC